MKHNNWFWGVFFLLAAVFVVASQVSGFMVIGFGTIAASVLLAAVFIQSLVKLNFFGVFLSLALAYMLYQHPLELYIINPWLLLLAAVLLSISFHILFGRRAKCRFEGRRDACGGGSCIEDGTRTYEDVDGNNPFVKLSFGSSSKYIHADALKTGQFSCSFAALSVYFDQAQLDPDGAEIYVDCNFGELKLYFPKEWKLVDKLKTTLGSVRNDLRAGSAPDGPEVLLTGGTSFGSIEVLYI